MSLPSDIVENIRTFSLKCEGLEKQREEDYATAYESHGDDYQERVDEALRTLQEQVDAREATLRDLRATRPLDLPRPGLDPATRLAQIRRATAAYRSLAKREPELPTPDSPVNGLLALREVSRLVQELKNSISAVQEDITSNRARLKTEEGNLRDAQLITLELRKRLEELRGEQQKNVRNKKNSSQVAKELIQRERNREVELEEKTGEMKRALEVFVDERLAPMLAAEDLGGPVVGDKLEIADTTLEAGYTARGKERKPKENGASKRGSRQQRIDNLIRGQDGCDATDRNAREAAATEMHTLLEKLLDTPSTPYIELERESAASRFLIKSKIAQFHPRDSRKIRLINVTREISD